MALPRVTAVPAAGRSWQQELAQAITDPCDLLHELDLPQSWLTQVRAASRHFPLKVTRSYLEQIRRGDPHDPLLRQIFPVGAELQALPGFVDDPVGDRPALVTAGLVHKYHGRVLLITTGACAIHCRYCFRRHFPYAANASLGRQWPNILNHVRTHREIREVILSGGDPMVLSDRRLQQLYRDLNSVEHVNTIRIHSRLPVVLPSRVTPELLTLLRTSTTATVYVVHVNHPRELSTAARQALTLLATTVRGIYNQSVLLRGVNDDPDVLIELSQELFSLGIQPYYLHLLDRVAGAAHFEVPRQRVRDIYRQLLARLPGYLVPRLVRETPGSEAKEPWPGSDDAV